MKNNKEVTSPSTKKEKRKDATFIEKAEVLKKYWIDTDDIMILLPICRSVADAERKKITDQLDKEQAAAAKITDSLLREEKLIESYYFKTKPILIPKDRLVKNCHINEKLIFEEAAKIENFMKGVN